MTKGKKILQSVRRIQRLSLAAVRESIRQRVAWLLLAVALLLTFAGMRLREFNFGIHEARFLSDFATGTRTLLGGLLALLLPVLLFFPALERQTLQLDLMHGASRGEWLFSRLFAVWVQLACFVAVTTGVQAILLYWRGLPFDLAGLTLDTVMAFVRLAVIAAASLLLCTLCASSLLVLGLGALFVMAGQLAPVLGHGCNYESGIVCSIGALLSGLVPNLQILDSPTAGTDLAGLPAITWVILYGSGYCLLYASLAGLAFFRREL